MDTRSVLPVKTMLDNSYRVVRAVGCGGFGITYEAEDVNLGTAVAVKEYYPCDFGDRDRGMSVRPRSERHRHTFAWGRANFLEEARTLARFEHPSIVQVMRVFEANSTAYMVMRFEQGQSFEAWLKGLGRLPTQEELDRILFPLLDALDLMHKAQFLHRDIAPDNIIVRVDGTPVLLDFGAARRAMAEKSRTLTGLVKPGYSPLEQYAGDGRLQGPWSDLYALGGTLYRAVAGELPDEATLRIDDDRMLPVAQTAAGRYRASFLAAIDACLSVGTADRPQSVAQLRGILRQNTAAGFDLPRSIGTHKKPSKPQPLARTRRTGPTLPPAAGGPGLAIAAAVLVLLGGAYGGFEYARWRPDDRVVRADPPGPERHDPALEEARRKEDDARREREAREAQRRAAEAAEAREKARIAALEEAHRRDEDARREREAREAQQRAAEAAEAREKARIAALEEARRKDDEARRETEATEAQRRAAEAAVAREKARIAALEEARSATKVGDVAAREIHVALGQRPGSGGAKPGSKGTHPGGERETHRDVASHPPIQGIR